MDLCKQLLIINPPTEKKWRKKPWLLPSGPIISEHSLLNNLTVLKVTKTVLIYTQLWSYQWRNDLGGLPKSTRYHAKISTISYNLSADTKLAIP